MAARGGLCMVSFVPRFVSQANRDWALAAEDAARDAGIDPKELARFEPFLDDLEAVDPPPAATLADVVAHVEHVRDVAGIDHVGLGGDYDGVTTLPEGLEDVSRYPNLLEALGRAGLVGRRPRQAGVPQRAADDARGRGRGRVGRLSDPRLTGDRSASKAEFRPGSEANALEVRIRPRRRPPRWPSR